MPSLKNLNQHFKDKSFVLLSISVAEEGDVVKKFARNNNLSHKILLDEDSAVSTLYGIRSHPAKFLIDTKGNLYGAALGFREWDKAEMKSLIKLLIKRGGDK